MMLLANTVVFDGPLMAITALIAGAAALIALKLIGSEIEYARRVHRLQNEVRLLREQQIERLRNLRPRR